MSTPGFASALVAAEHALALERAEVDRLRSVLESLRRFAEREASVAPGSRWRDALLVVASDAKSALAAAAPAQPSAQQEEEAPQ